MPITRYAKAVKCLKKYMEITKKHYIFTNDLKNLIRREIGSDEKRCVLPLLKLCQDMNLIKEVSVNKWEINLGEI